MRDRVRRATGSVRVRVTFAATLLLGTVLVTAAALLTYSVERRLVAANRADAQTFAGLVADSFEAGEPVDSPIGQAQFVVFDPHGTAVAGSGPLFGTAAASGSSVAAAYPVGEFAVVGALPVTDLTDWAGPEPIDAPVVELMSASVSPPFGEATLAFEPVEVGGVDYVAMVANPLDDVRASVHAMAQNVRLGLPIVLALFATLVWYLTGRALRPVERIRGEVAEITATTLDRRVQVPPTSDEVARLARTMNEMLDRLHTASDRERRFIADASHELRSPLASLRAQIETSWDAQHSSDQEAAASTSAVRGDLDRLQHVIDDLIDLARATEAPVPDVEVDLDEVVLGEVAAARATVHDLTIDATAVHAAKVRGSAPALARLARNLLDNAARHATSTIAVSLHRGPGDVTLAIDDDGCGVPASHREHVFDRFARLDEGRARPEGGVGLGLAVVRATALRHGGHARCVASPLGGARFEITLATPPDL